MTRFDDPLKDNYGLKYTNDSFYFRHWIHYCIKVKSTETKFNYSHNEMEFWRKLITCKESWHGLNAALFSSLLVFSKISENEKFFSYKDFLYVCCFSWDFIMITNILFAQLASTLVFVYLFLFIFFVFLFLFYTCFCMFIYLFVCLSVVWLFIYLILFHCCSFFWYFWYVCLLVFALFAYVFGSLVNLLFVCSYSCLFICVFVYYLFLLYLCFIVSSVCLPLWGTLHFTVPE